MKYWLSVVFVILFSITSLCSVVYAEECFSDLTPSDLYYDSVMELVNEGVISGYSDGTFKPDNNILVCEALTIIEKVFGTPENLPEWSKWAELSDTGYIYKTDWNLNSMLFFNNYIGNVDYESAGHLIFASNGVALLCPEMYGYSNQFQNMGNLQLRGYVTNKDSCDLISRAEFCDLVVWAKYNINNVPDYSKEIPVKYNLIGYDNIEESKVTESYVLGAFRQCPDWLLNYFNSKNGLVKIISYDKWDNENFKYASATYTHSNIKPTIQLCGADKGVALHELGHFIWFEGRLSLPKGLFESESVYLVSVMNDDYCKTNEREFFAEVIKGYFLYPKRLKELCPQTYEFVEKVCLDLERVYGRI